jgi:hypothetical protein
MWRGMPVCCLLLVMTCAHNAAHAQALEPPIPSHPTSDEDCIDWGQQLDEYWENKVLKGSREHDAYCKTVSKEPSKPITGPCGNVTATVTSKLCDTERHFSQCSRKQKERGLEQCRQRLAKSTNQPIKKTGRPTLPSMDSLTTKRDKGNASIKSDCFGDTQKCMTACLNAGESDHSLCTEECFAPDTKGRGYCFGRAP